MRIVSRASARPASCAPGSGPVPEAGAANAALRRLIARNLDVPQMAVILESGHRGRTKRLRVDGVVAADLARRWPGLVVVDAPDRAVG